MRKKKKYTPVYHRNYRRKMEGKIEKHYRKYKLRLKSDKTGDVNVPEAQKKFKPWKMKSK